MSPTDVFTQCQSEVLAVLKKYDLAGIVIIGTPKAIDFNLHLSTTWSALSLFCDHARFNTMTRPPEDRKQFACDTTAIIMGMIDATQHVQDKLVCLRTMLSRHLNIQHYSRLVPPYETDYEI